LAFPLGADGLEVEDDGPAGGLAGKEADAGGVDDLDFAPRGGFVDEFVLGWGWNGSAMDDNFGPVLVFDDVEVFIVAEDPAAVVDAFSSISIFSLSSSTGIVAFGSIGNLSSRQSLSKSVIWLNIWTRPSAVS
jgi:hypothetical protein